MTETGFTLKIHNPIVGKSQPFERIYQSEILGWDQEHALDGGEYKAATFKIAIHESEIDDWLENGLARDVQTFAPTGIGIGEYFINVVTINTPNVTVRRGPLADMANRVSVEYTPYIDITVDPATTREATVTTIVEDPASVEKYGAIEKMFNHGSLVDDATYIGGGVPENEAERIRDSYLEDIKSPVTTQEFKLQEGGTYLELEIECLGYGWWLEAFIYDNPFVTIITIPDKIKAVLAYDTNAIFSTDYDEINEAANFLLLTPDGSDGLSNGKEIIEEMVAQGDANDNRTVFLIRDGRKAYYDVISSKIDYVVDIKDGKLRFKTQSDVTVQPWEIRPGKWLLFTGFLPGLPYPTAPDRDDPRCEFIESVRFTTPDQVEITGSRLSHLPQLLKKVNFTL